MANIRVKTNNNTTTVRVGQTNAIKVVASNQSAAVGTVDNMSNVGDVNTGARSTNTFLCLMAQNIFMFLPSNC